MLLLENNQLWSSNSHSASYLSTHNMKPEESVLMEQQSQIPILPVQWCACGSHGSRCSGGRSSRCPRYHLGSYGWLWWRRARRSSRGRYTRLAWERGLEKHQLLDTNQRSEDKSQTPGYTENQMGRERRRRQTSHGPRWGKRTAECGRTGKN